MEVASSNLVIRSHKKCMFRRARPKNESRLRDSFLCPLSAFCAAALVCSVRVAVRAACGVVRVFATGSHAHSWGRFASNMVRSGALVHRPPSASKIRAMTSSTSSESTASDPSAASAKISQSLREAAEAWIAADPDPQMATELKALLEADDADEVHDRVGFALEFGTAGLRGVVGAGPNRMNQAVIIRTTRGLADYLLAEVPDAAKRGVVVGFDARHDSTDFAAVTLSVLAAAGIKVHWFPTPQPTPLIAFTQAALDAAAAVVITASHNPAEYNGYKVYVQGAAQIVPPTDAAIASAIKAVGPANQVPRAEIDANPLVSVVEDDVVTRYLDAIADARPNIDVDRVEVVYTPLHGVGGPLMKRAMSAGGYSQLHVVASQAEPDGDFPTVRFPNPEEPGAMDAALALAEQTGAPLVLANDPDADRLAAAVSDDTGRFEALTGNQIGILLADHLLAGASVARPLVICSIVSTPMLDSVAAAYDAHAETTLTGFKWIAAAARVLEADGYDFVFGFEEALGSSVGPVVRDKDGIGAAVAFADLVSELTAQGRTVAQQWKALCLRHGLWVSQQLAVTLPGAAGQQQIAQAMASLPGSVPESLAGHAVTSVTDYRAGAAQRPPWLGSTDLVALELADGRAMIRPSGTEPKCKVYVDLRAPLGEDDDTDALTAQLKRDADAVAGALASAVGLA